MLLYISVLNHSGFFTTEPFFRFLIFKIAVLRAVYWSQNYYFHYKKLSSEFEGLEMVLVEKKEEVLAEEKKEELPEQKEIPQDVADDDDDDEEEEDELVDPIDALRYVL